MTKGRKNYFTHFFLFSVATFKKKSINNVVRSMFVFFRYFHAQLIFRARKFGLITNHLTLQCFELSNHLTIKCTNFCHQLSLMIMRIALGKKRFRANSMGKSIRLSFKNITRIILLAPFFSTCFHFKNFKFN